MIKKQRSRRSFLKKASLATGALWAGTSYGFPTYIKNLGKPNSKINGVQIGAITYSFRSLDQDAESVLQHCLNSGISAIELMGNTAESFAGAPENPFRGRWRPRRRSGDEELTKEQKQEMAERQRGQIAYAQELALWRAKATMEKFEQLRRMYNEAGVSIYAWKPSALRINNTDEEIKYAFKVAKVLRANHVTVEIPGDVAHSLRLGQLAKKHKVYVGYHGHLQQTFTAWDEALGQSRFNALNADIGHYVAAGFDPLPLLEAKSKKIRSIHLKDRKNKENGQDNMPWGQGDTPIAESLRLMRDKKYRFPGSIELEYTIPEGSDAVKEVAKCLAYCREALK